MKFKVLSSSGLISCVLVLSGCSHLSGGTTTLPKGSGIPLYGMGSDLVCTKGVCKSQQWLSTLDAQKQSAHLKYVYPNYPYVNFLLPYDTPSNPVDLKDITNFFSTDKTNPYTNYYLAYAGYTKGKGWYATGQSINQAYSDGSQFLILPTVSIDSVTVEAANKCYTKQGSQYTFDPSTCNIPVPNNTNGAVKNPAFKNYDWDSTQNIGGQYYYKNIPTEVDLKSSVYNTGMLIGKLIHQDTSANGVSFDIEGPPFISVLAQSFYSGVIAGIGGKYIGVWRGVNIFGRDTQDYKTLQMLAQHNGFIILSTYDIGPTDGTTVINASGNTLYYVHGGGTNVAQPALWYGGNPINGAPEYSDGSAKSNYNVFETTLFGVPQNTTPVSFDCHPKEDMLYKAASRRAVWYNGGVYTSGDYWLTGFNGCVGSQSFMNRFLNPQTITGGAITGPVNIPFQVGIPAVASTTEWVKSMVWFLKSYEDTLPVLRSQLGLGWLSTTTCPSQYQISGYDCLVALHKTPIQDITQYLDDGKGNGVLNTIKSYWNGAVFSDTQKNPSYVGSSAFKAAGLKMQSYLKENFMGLYIYGLKGTHFDVDNCKYLLTRTLPKGETHPGTCYANFPTSTIDNNDIPDSAWSAIGGFFKAIGS